MREIKDYDYVVAGAGIFGAIVAERLASHGNAVLVVEKRDHIAGNIYSYTDEETGIEIHKYGSHIFHTELDEVWDYITRFTEFNDYTHTVNTRYRGKLYPMPINLDTINLLYNTNMDAEEAEKFVAQEAAKTGITDPKNFEVLSLLPPGPAHCRCGRRTSNCSYVSNNIRINMSVLTITVNNP